LGHQNDALGADITEGQVFSKDKTERAAQEAYLHLDNRFVPAIAETEHFDKGKSGTCARNVPLIKSRRYTSIHKRFNLKTLNQWRTEGCFTEIEKHLGYRLVLLESALPDAIDRRQPLNLRLTVQNQGWAAPANRRGVEIVLRDRATGREYRLDASKQTDPRYWLPEKNRLVVDLKLKHKLPPGTYYVLLNLPDPAPSLRNRAEYSIQLANQQMWEANTGLNALNRTLTVR
jgi:hypothetical protein